VYKQGLVLWRRADLTRDFFKKYYDDHHMECIAGHLRQPPISHERNYPIWDDPLSAIAFPWLASIRFDVFAMMTFRDASVRAEWRKTMSDDRSAREQIQKDEQEFMATDLRMLCVLEEVTSSRTVCVDDARGQSVDVLRLVRYRNEYPVQSVRQIHEQDATACIEKLNGEIVTYRRNYALAEHPWNYRAVQAESEVPLRWADVTEELAIKDRSAAPIVLQLLDSSTASQLREVTTVVVEKSTALPSGWRPR
jgi:hypothetical protein